MLLFTTLLVTLNAVSSDKRRCNGIFKFIWTGVVDGECWLHVHADPILRVRHCAGDCKARLWHIEGLSVLLTQGTAFAKAYHRGSLVGKEVIFKNLQLDSYAFYKDTVQHRYVDAHFMIFLRL